MTHSDISLDNIPLSDRPNSEEPISNSTKKPKTNMQYRDLYHLGHGHRAHWFDILGHRVGRLWQIEIDTCATEQRCCKCFLETNTPQVW